jgi:hypothetical protein
MRVMMSPSAMSADTDECDVEVGTQIAGVVAFCASKCKVNCDELRVCADRQGSFISPLTGFFIVTHRHHLLSVINARSANGDLLWLTINFSLVAHA